MRDSGFSRSGSESPDTAGRPTSLGCGQSGLLSARKDSESSSKRLFAICMERSSAMIAHAQAWNNAAAAGSSGPRLSSSSRQTAADLLSSPCSCRLVSNLSPPSFSPVTSGRAGPCNPSPQCLPDHGLVSGETGGINQEDTRAERSFPLPVIRVFEPLHRAKRAAGCPQYCSTL